MTADPDGGGEHPRSPGPAARWAARVGHEGPLAVACVSLALLTFPVAFNLGAYGEVLYPDVFRILVASFVVLCVTFFTPAYGGRRLWVTRIVLASPGAWLAASLLILGSTAEATERPAFLAWLLATIAISVPVTLKMLFDLFDPELHAEQGWRLTGIVAGVVVVVAVAGFVIGTHNDRVMTCDDFVIAGSAEPENCDP